MGQGKQRSSMPGVAEGKKLVGVPTDRTMSPVEKANHFVAGAMSGEYTGWGSEFFASGKVKLVDASAEPAGRAVFEFVVDEAYCNRLGNQHGGCTATLFDICTTVALAPIARPGFWAYAGVTRTLSLTYLRPMALGEEIVLECEVVHAGKRMCLIKGVMKRKKDGAITATCEHGKASIDPEMPSKL